jgi:hypothetical protein
MSYIGNQPLYTSYVNDRFSGNGSTVSFLLSIAPVNSSSILVAIYGVLQDPATYGVVGNTLTFTGAPPAGTNNISVRYLGLPASNVVTSSYRTVTDIIATAGQTTFSPASYTPGFIDVYRNGARLGTADYTATNGAQVILNNAAALGDLLQFESFSVGSVLNAIPANGGVITAGYLDVASKTGTGAMTLPAGTTAQRPTSPSNGMIRKNTTTGYIEYWDIATSNWLGLGAFSATGGIVSQSGGYQLHAFTASGNFVVAAGAKAVEVLVVAGGGAGGWDVGGGGGAGGLIYSSAVSLSVGSYSIVIGAGGTAATSGGGTAPSGSSTTAFGLTAIGGGGGGQWAGGSGASGGSGGGSTSNMTTGGAGTAGQGFAGGTAAGNTSNVNEYSGASGGGGASQQGGNGTASGWTAGSTTFGYGGAGNYYAQFAGVGGSPAGWFAGGGGSASDGQSYWAVGGNGGGARGGAQQNATANTGGGGGGAGTTPNIGGNGGSGIVIVRYAL